MKVKLLSMCILCVSGIAFSQPKEVNTSDKLETTITKNTRTELREKLLTLNTFSAEFEQFVYDEANELLQTGKGQVELKRPNMIRWHQIEPDDTVLVSNGATTYYYDEFAEQVSVYDGKKLLDDSPFALLTSNNDALWQQYDVELNGNNYVVKPAASHQSQIEKLIIEYQNLNIKSLIVFDISGQNSKYVFSQNEYNKEIDNGTFVFSIPDGVMIDDQRQGG